ncbi:MAG: YdcF family protein [Kurthia sp.]
MRWMTRMIIISGGLFIVFWFSMGYVMEKGKKPRATGNVTYAIVLGAKVKPGKIPSKALQNRLDAAYDYATANPNVILIVSGGQGEDEDATESSVMRTYLIDKGLAESRIIEEDQSTSTYENIKYSMKKMPLTETKVTIISNDFHLARGKMIANYFGLEADVVPAKTPKSIQLHAEARERVGLIAQRIKLWR